MLWRTWKTQVSREGTASCGHSSKTMYEYHCIITIEVWNLKLEKKNTRISRKAMAGNHPLCLAHTCGKVTTSTSFIENVACKGSCTDDQKACSHHGDDSQKHQDCPETTVNWKPQRGKEKRKPHLDCEPHLDCTTQSVSFHFIVLISVPAGWGGIPSHDDPKEILLENFVLSDVNLLLTRVWYLHHTCSVQCRSSFSWPCFPL